MSTNMGSVRDVLTEAHGRACQQLRESYDRGCMPGTMPVIVGDEEEVSSE